MSGQVAKTHTHASNRIKPAERSERRLVYKSVLDNPYRISWFVYFLGAAHILF
jgi:ribonuclease P/MRP protein subunit POP3